MQLLGKEQIAKVCHEVNRAYCEAIGDWSQVSWEEAEDWQRKSAIAGVEFILANPEAKPSDSHESWLKEKEADGWKYGEKKNILTKEHPCFVPYDKLPVEQKAKDYLFQAVVRSLSPEIKLDNKITKGSVKMFKIKVKDVRWDLKEDGLTPKDTLRNLVNYLVLPEVEDKPDIASPRHATKNQYQENVDEWRYFFSTMGIETSEEKVATAIRIVGGMLDNKKSKN